MKKIILGLMLGSVPISYSAMACNPANYTLVSASKTKTEIYAGLNWNLDDGVIPALVLGVSHTKVQSDGDTEGGNLALHINLKDGIKPDKLRLSYLKGKEDLQGEFGVGYDFKEAGPLALLGVNGPFAAAGINVYLNPGFVPYLQLQSLGKFDKPSLDCKRVAEDTGDYTDAVCTVPAP